MTDLGAEAKELERLANLLDPDDRWRNLGQISSAYDYILAARPAVVRYVFMRMERQLRTVEREAKRADGYAALVTKLEKMACSCDAGIGYTCGVHAFIGEATRDLP